MRFSDKAEALSAINDALRTEDWKEDFFSDEIMSLSDLFESEDRVRSAKIFPYGGFYEKELEALCREDLAVSAEKIAEWLVSGRRTLRIEFHTDVPIGYTVSDPWAEKEPSCRYVLSLRREREPQKTKYGFFVSAFNVI